MNIEWKEGAVCFDGNEQWFPSIEDGELISVCGSYGAYFDDLISNDNFQLNEIKQGDYIPESELDTEQKYNDAVEALGLFGFKFKAGAASEFNVFYSCESLTCCDDGLWQTETELWDDKRKITFQQLMVIGELKRMMNERDNAALQHPPAPSLEVESDSNDEWPKVGDDAVLHLDKDPLRSDELNLDEHCIVDTWRSGDALEVIAIVETFDERRLPVVQNKRTREVSSIITECIKKPKSKEDLLIEELQAKLVENSAVDNWMLAASIINGDIKGLTYKGGSDE